MLDAVKNFRINDAKYYKSNIDTASDTKGNLTRNPETVTHTSNGHFEKELLSNRTILVVVPEMNPIIDQGISPVVLAPQTLLVPTMKEVITDTALVGTWVNRTPWQVSRTGVDGRTPGKI